MIPSSMVMSAVSRLVDAGLTVTLSPVACGILTVSAYVNGKEWTYSVGWLALVEANLDIVSVILNKAKAATTTMGET